MVNFKCFEKFEMLSTSSLLFSNWPIDFQRRIDKNCESDVSKKLILGENTVKKREKNLDENEKKTVTKNVKVIVFSVTTIWSPKELIIKEKKINEIQNNF